MDLHYSQTINNCLNLLTKFESPMDLHYSQTYHHWQLQDFRFESPMDLHYSQTDRSPFSKYFCLNPLWIYTTLKQQLTIQK